MSGTVAGLVDLLQLPNVAIEIDICLDALDALAGLPAGQTVRGMFTSAIASAFTDARTSLAANPQTQPIVGLLPAPPQTVDVRSNCFSAAEKTGVWFKPVLLKSASSSQQDATRNLRLSEIQLLNINDSSFAMQVPVGTLNLMLQTMWNYLTSNNNRINDQGIPDPKGHVELRSWNLSSPTPASVVLTVNGTYHDTVKVVTFSLPVAVDFVLSNVETLSTVGQNPYSWVRSVISQNLSLNKSQIEQIEAGFFFATAPFGLLGLGGFEGLYNLVEGLLQSALAGLMIPKFGIAQQLLQILPIQTLIPNTSKKIVFSYDGFNSSMAASGTGLTVTGTNLPTIMTRQPAVMISGPDRLPYTIIPGPTTPSASAMQNLTVTGAFEILSVDMRPPFQIKWSGDGQIATPNQATTNITFHVGATPAVRKITLTITDADGTTASATINVQTLIVYEHVASTTAPIHHNPLTVIGTP